MATTSLPIIPPRAASQSQRPKLCINTEQPRIPGKCASLRLDLLSAVSPTVRNTFSNAYDQSAATATSAYTAYTASASASASAPVLGRPTKPRLSIDSNFSSTRATPTSTPDSAATLSSALTSASSSQSASSSIPYKQPHNLASILTNSPARSTLPRKMTTPARPMFPAEKRVSFRTPLEEEITTVKYTLAHSDLQSSLSTLSSNESTTSTMPSGPEAANLKSSLCLDTSHSTCPHQIAEPPSKSPSRPLNCMDPATEISPPRKAPRIGEKRDSSSSDDDSDSCPETPVAGRRKRTRDWRWTLGQLAGKGVSSDEDLIELVTGEESN
ncbi:hypothetical protein LEMA_P040420.1 [Plenodomus lingam JN3]|uniref:Uncharacterized protein n=1 Tax=Leptosphaeria maculans (strain JN3 / isolate v23.1.3 / race Av1-4-5-6-7-8) TaxID=985895 RepID=E4ZPB6_LEPMJ|nr:hypothetical protein LEMA_P040420.1 [Plenodomus lingam JN3]CBX93141.1 hypothetical protein LEMA_P040420.1 [Plenodomus lingam JN3]